MTTIVPSARRAVLADVLPLPARLTRTPARAGAAVGPVAAVRPRLARVAVDAALVLAGTALVAGTAQLAVPFWPVPLTGQTFAVLVVGTALGAWRGAASLAVYLLAGVLGAPIFSDRDSGSLLALPSGGFVIAFIPAAFLVGALAQRSWDRRVVGTLLSFLGGTVVMYLIGLPWLAVSLAHLGAGVWHDGMGYDSVAGAVLGTGLLPFIAGDIAKAVLAALALPTAWRGVHAAERKARGADH